MIGLGTRLYWSTDGITYSELTNLLECGSPDTGSLEQIEETPLNPTNRRREYVLGLYDTVLVGFKQYWTKTRYNALLTYRDSAQLLYWRVVAPDATVLANCSKWEFAGLLKQWMAPSFKLRESLVIDAQIQVSANITFTPGP